MGHCSRKPGAERRYFFELKRYVRADRVLWPACEPRAGHQGPRCHVDEVIEGKGRKGGTHFYLKLKEFSEFFDSYPQAYPRRGTGKSSLQAADTRRTPLAARPVSVCRGRSPARLSGCRGSAGGLSQPRPVGQGVAIAVAKSSSPNPGRPSLYVHLVR